MEIQNDTLRYLTYAVVLLIALFVAVKIFPLTLSVFTVLATSPLGLLAMLISFVFYVVFITGIFTSKIIEPKEEPKIFNSNNVESVKKFTSLSEDLQQRGLKKVSEKIVFFEPNEKSILIETTFKNTSNEKISFNYIIQFLKKDGANYGETVSLDISLDSQETYPYTFISPSHISGRVFNEEQLSFRGIFIEIK